MGRGEDMSTSNNRVMKLALEALDMMIVPRSFQAAVRIKEIYETIEAEIANQEQRSVSEHTGEPVSFDAWYGKFHSFAGKSFLLYSDLHCAWQAAKLYTTPQPKQEQGEIERLTAALKKANAQAEHLEREWYLRGDELEKLKQEQRSDSEQLGEPVGDVTCWTIKGNLKNHDFDYYGNLPDGTHLLYTTAEQSSRTLAWVGLTMEDIDKAKEDNMRFGGFRVVGFAYDLEKLLKEKNYESR
jgi:hypothetical protein